MKRKMAGPGPTLTKKTIEDILEYIKRNELKAGDKLPTETEFLEKLGVSRIILREAFSYLKGLGLVDSRRGSGFRLTGIDFACALEQALEHISVVGEGDIAELMDLRRRLEIGTIHTAVLNANKKDIKNVKAVLRKLEELCRLPAFTRSEYQLIELEFHQALIAPARSRTINIVNTAIQKFFEAASGPERIYGTESRDQVELELNEHRIIAYAFELGWADIAQLALRRHLFNI
jgi:GntR family transcriptional repressor for pyruvate dehydrogenase complex